MKPIVIKDSNKDRKEQTMKIDMWYGDEFECGKYGADAYFTPGNGYHGNIYDGNGKMIGDYRTADSTKIEKCFLIKWNNA